MINYWWNPETAIQVSPGIDTSIDLKMSQRKKVKTKHYKCNEADSSQREKCLETFYMAKLGCQFPWIQNGSNICKNLSEMKNILAEIADLNGKTRMELENSDCFVPNCDQKTWEMINRKPKNLNLNNFTLVSLNFQSASKVHVIKETLTYGLTNFLSDLGGFMGLFFGYSLLSLFKDLPQKCYQKS